MGDETISMIVIMALGCAIGWAISTLIKSRKKGKRGCSWQCGSCPMSSTCEKRQKINSISNSRRGR